MQPTTKVELLIKAWYQSARELESLKTRVDQLTIQHKEHTEQLADILLPADALAGEKIGVWYGDSIIMASHNNGVKRVEVRQRGRSL